MNNKELIELLLEPLKDHFERLLHEAFVKGYERGKADEKDAKEIDKVLYDK